MPDEITATEHCAKSAELFEFINGGLSSSARRELESHIDRCAVCFDAVAAALTAPSEESVRQRGEATGRYTILRVLGEGAMGTVYAGYDPVLDRTVALKVLRRNIQPTEERKTRLLREAQVLAKVHHPNVVTVHDAGESGGGVYLAMELIEGVSLREHLRVHTPSWREVLALFEQAGQGLAAAHDAGLVHRDFKPSNVLVARTGRVVVTDFGLAALAPEQPSTTSGVEYGDSFIDARLTLTRARMGTPAYMPIEQIDGQPATPKSDQFSFCVSLVEALVGRRPFVADTMVGLREAQRRGLDAEVLRGLPGPPSLARALDRGLAVDPLDRHASMSVLLGALRRSMVQTRNTALGLAALAVVVAVGAAWHWTHRSPPQCNDPLAYAWGDARRAEVEAALLGASDGEPREAGTRAVERLDAYAGDLAGAYAEVCKSLPYDLRDLDEGRAAQWTCLQTRRVGLDALTQKLAAQQERHLEQAARLIGSLDPVAACGSSFAALRAMPIPHDEDRAQQVLALRMELAELRPAIAATDGRVVDELADLTARAEAIGYRPVLAEIVFQAVRLRSALEQYEWAVEQGQRAYDLAVQSRHESVARSAATGLIVTLGALERWDEGEVWARVARPLQRTDGQRADLEWTLGRFAYTRGDFDQARAHYEEASRYAAMVPDPALLNSRIDSDYGITLAELGEYRESARVLARGIEGNRALLGADHISLASSLVNLSAVEARMNDYEAAKTHLEQALEIVRRSATPPPQLEMTLHLNLGVTHAGAGHWAEADASIDRASRGADVGFRAHLQATKAGFAIWRGDYAEGLAACRSALHEVQRARGAEHRQARELEILCLGYATETRSVDAEAAARAQALLTEFGEPIAAADRNDAVFMLWVAGLDALRRGDADEAVARMEHASRLDSSADTPGLVPFMRVDFAEALWKTQPRRARAMLDDVLADVSTLPPYRGAAVQLRVAALEERLGSAVRALQLARAARSAAEASGAGGLQSRAAQLIERLESGADL